MQNPNMMMPQIPFKSMIEQCRYGIFVSQKVDLLEMISGCETANRYHIYQMNSEHRKFGPPLMKCKEESNYIAK